MPQVHDIWRFGAPNIDFLAPDLYISQFSETCERVVLGSFDETTLVDGRWVPGRRLNGDETDHNRRWQGMRAFGIYRYTIFRRD